MTTIHIRELNPNRISDLLGEIISSKEDDDKEVILKFENPRLFAKACGYRVSTDGHIDPNDSSFEGYSLEDFLGAYASHFTRGAIYSIPETLEILLEFDNPLMVNLFPSQHMFQQLLNYNN